MAEVMSDFDDDEIATQQQHVPEFAASIDHAYDMTNLKNGRDS